MKKVLKNQARLAARRGFSLPLVLVIVAVGIVAVVTVTFLIRTQLAQQSEQAQVIQTPPIPTSTPIPIPIPTSTNFYPNRITIVGDQKIYSHKGYGFSFRFPKEWTVDHDDLPESPSDPEHGGYGGTLNIADFSKTEKPGLAVRIDTAYGVAESDIKYTLSLTSEGLEVTDRKLVPPSKPGGITTPHQDDGVIVIRAVRTIKSNAYWIDFGFKDGGKDYEPLFKQIIESFKFLD